MMLCVTLYSFVKKTCILPPGQIYSIAPQILGYRCTGHLFLYKQMICYPLKWLPADNNTDCKSALLSAHRFALMCLDSFVIGINHCVILK